MECMVNLDFQLNVYSKNKTNSKTWLQLALVKSIIKNPKFIRRICFTNLVHKDISFY